MNTALEAVRHNRLLTGEISTTEPKYTAHSGTVNTRAPTVEETLDESSRYSFPRGRSPSSSPWTLGVSHRGPPPLRRTAAG